MGDQTQLKTIDPKIMVERVSEQLSPNDLNDLCDATDAAIEGGGGFGWVELPARDTLENYWRGVVTAPTRELFVARLDDTICGTTQLMLPPKNNEAQGHVVHLTTNFVAPWARGYHLAKMLLEEVEKHCLAEGYAVINLDVRETMTRAIEVYEGMGYVQFGLHPYSVRAKGETIKSRYYYKVINPKFFE
ncbi:MAG: GNAT family N-acetyltransferase [Alphaproteobacteria bacterium]|nr:GNAT family N-acetyltransferase [Alphaproteobacteria bacterium]NCQ88492.1 GNAT family N-acetyltransferase [Alphaproteobacteria bacterium]NCT06035.1 GNAT family N-acetyltransferase [Alphaproteobacteria bacterium]